MRGLGQFQPQLRPIDTGLGPPQYDAFGLFPQVIGLVHFFELTIFLLGVFEHFLGRLQVEFGHFDHQRLLHFLESLPIFLGDAAIPSVRLLLQGSEPFRGDQLGGRLLQRQLIQLLLGAKVHDQPVDLLRIEGQDQVALLDDARHVRRP